MVRNLLISFFLLISLLLHSQSPAVVHGKVSDAHTGEALVGASVSSSSARGTITDTDGGYLFMVPPGRITLSYQYLGYQPVTRTVVLRERDSLRLDIRLSFSSSPMNEVVISAGKYAQNLSELTVSMEVIKPRQIINTNATSLDAVIDQTPGLQVIDGQANIRGGSGYSYGTGSRVLMLLNDLPLLSADASDVKWDFIPLENVAQVEVLKGASSVLYGTSALNGVIHVRTAFPGLEPVTRIQCHSGLYLNPLRNEMVWWDRQRWFGGVSATHARKAGNLDLVVGAEAFTDEGYRKDEYEKRVRVNTDLRYRNQRIPGLAYGLRANVMGVDKTDFLLWQNAAEGALIQQPDVVSQLGGSRYNIDPYVEYLRPDGSRHNLHARMYGVNNVFTEETDKNNSFSDYFAEYRYHGKIGGWGDWTSGIAGSFASIHSRLYGDHTSGKAAVYSQLDSRITGFLRLSAGVRWETYRLNRETDNSRPVFRAGVNVQPFKSTFVRASFGQGYRFPSVAEKFAATSVGALNIFPNPALEPEAGWSAEIGLKQGVGTGEFRGYLDISAFVMRYRDMIEFTFGVYPPPGQDPSYQDIGFKSLNIRNARISGIEFTAVGEGTILGIETYLSAGYSYIHPVDLDIHDPDSTEHILKYRNKHSAKADLQLTHRKFSTGFTMVYNSFMVNVDAAFTDPFPGALILPGYAAYRSEHDKGYLVVDHRVSFQFTQALRLALITKNLFNREYMIRPGDIRPPRNVSLQLSLVF